jgi:DNA modification methylase
MSAQLEYQKFIEGKIAVGAQAGFEVELDDVDGSLFPHQQDAVVWALRKGRALIAMSFGLGKTAQQVEIARHVHQRTGKLFLVIAPLGVRHQFVQEDGARMGVRFQYVRTDAEVRAADTPFLITNYERVRDGQIDPLEHDFGGVSLDEGSILRGLGTKTSERFKQVLTHIPYRFVCTATPAPNQFRELIYYAQFLGVMDAGQALTRWFKRDPSKAGNLMLHPQHEADFWLWVASWGLFLNRPSDLGHSDLGYDLPDLQVHWHRIAGDHTRAFDQSDNRGQRKLLVDVSASAIEAAREKRATLGDRKAKMLELVSGLLVDGRLSKQIVIWVHLNDEQTEVERELKHLGISVSSIYGSLSPDEAEERLYAWKRRETDVLLSKPVMLGAGLNLQQAHTAVYLGIDYKFEDFIQSVHRLHRFQQAHPVHIHIIHTDTEDHVVEVLQQKWQRHDDLTETMRGIVRKYGFSQEAMMGDLGRKIGVQREEVAGELFRAILNDTAQEIPSLESDSVGLIHTSIPFGNHYEYSVQYEDFGHNKSDGHFWQQMDFLIPELLRVLKPGRIAAIHVKDRILYGHQTPSGVMEVSPFSDECVAAFRKHGWLYEGRRTIATDVVRENNSTYRLSYTEMTKDASKMGSGLPEYLLLFRKPPTDIANSRADEPVTKSKDDYSIGRWQLAAHAIWGSNGNALVAQVAAPPYDFEEHVARLDALEEKGALPKYFLLEPPAVEHPAVWDDVIYMRTLNTNQSQKRRENHICPLPLDIVERTIDLYSNPGDVVLEPFMGIGTVPYVAIQRGRRAVGVELNYEYWQWACQYLRDAEIKASAPTLFDLLESEKEAEHVDA